MTKLTNYEKETIINWNEEEKVAYVFTHNKRMINKFDKLCKTNPEDFQLEKDSEYKHWGCKSYIIPKEFITIRTVRRKLNLTDEEKKIRSEQMKKMRENKNS